MTTKKILVTGGNGFIGSHIVDFLIQKKYEVISIDNLSGSNYGELINKNEKAKYYYGDVSNLYFLNTIFMNESIDSIFHIAANGNVPYSDKYPEVDFQYNARGTFNILNLAIKLDIKKFMYASTAAVYGNPIYTPIDESHDLNPISNYGVTKLYGEKLGLAYSKTYDLDFTAIRIFNTYGPRQPRYVLYDFIKKLSNNSKKLEILGDGKQKRSYSYISDTVRAFYLAYKSKISKGQVYNIAGEQVVSIKELASIISDCLGISPEYCYTGKSWKGDINKLIGSIAKIQNDLDFQPSIDIRSGIKLSVKWFKENGYI